MRTPPPVVVRCQFGSVWRVFQAVVLGLASSVLVLRWGLHDLSLGESAAHGLYLLCVSMGLVATTVGWRMLAARSSELQWSGQAWSLAGAPLKGVDVQLDFGRWMLLQCQGVPLARQWQAVHEADNRPQWAAWRAAVYCAGRGGPSAQES
jgi:hypothetical protein